MEAPQLRSSVGTEAQGEDCKWSAGVKTGACPEEGDRYRRRVLTSDALEDVLHLRQLCDMRFSRHGSDLASLIRPAVIITDCDDQCT